jgi:hypothetical protein
LITYFCPLASRKAISSNTPVFVRGFSRLCAKLRAILTLPHNRFTTSLIASNCLGNGLDSGVEGNM